MRICKESVHGRSQLIIWGFLQRYYATVLSSHVFSDSFYQPGQVAYFYKFVESKGKLLKGYLIARIKGAFSPFGTHMHWKRNIPVFPVCSWFDSLIERSIILLQISALQKDKKYLFNLQHPITVLRKEVSTTKLSNGPSLENSREQSMSPIIKCV